jgi:hypothetical protein
MKLTQPAFFYLSVGTLVISTLAICLIFGKPPAGKKEFAQQSSEQSGQRTLEILIASGITLEETRMGPIFSAIYSTNKIELPLASIASLSNSAVKLAEENLTLPRQEFDYYRVREGVAYWLSESNAFVLMRSNSYAPTRFTFVFETR